MKKKPSKKELKQIIKHLQESLEAAEGDLEDAAKKLGIKTAEAIDYHRCWMTAIHDKQQALSKVESLEEELERCKLLAQ